MVTVGLDISIHAYTYRSETAIIIMHLCVFRRYSHYDKIDHLLVSKLSFIIGSIIIINYYLKF